MSQQDASGDERPGGLPRSGSASRLNAQAPEFVPRAPPPPAPAPTVVRLFARPPPPAAFFVAGPPPPPPPPFEYYAAAVSPGGGGAGGFGGAAMMAEQEAEVELAARDGIFDDVVHKVRKQVEYYFSDINLTTTEHLMRFINKDPEGYVPISVVASFKKIKALVQSDSILASALRTSSKLVVSDDGARVKRVQPFTVSDLEELQARIVVAENLPDDHCYQNLMRLFSAVGSVKTIRTCYPQAPNGTGPVTNKSAKLDMLFSNKLHAFVEYDTPEDAMKAIAELNDDRNWRIGLRVQLLNTCMTKGGKGRKGRHEVGYGEEENASTSDQPNDKHLEETSQLSDAPGEHVAEDGTGGDMGRGRGRGRGRGGRGRGRGYHHQNNNQLSHHQNSRSGAHAVGTPPSGQPVKIEQQQEEIQPQPQPPIASNKQPPGPRMPDGSRGFAMGRGKPQTSTPNASADQPEP
ncbi:hypothetical protein QOZ80_9BG0703730 [Eleusine coracana subsp. coracana]|nr:hypothetical protein QOZ80_9BG0703730 [Eleusine coracana subsp. coracana]